MTAFARQEVRGPWGGLVWEVRSFNHRYLEVSTRIPEELRTLEPLVREQVGRQVSRGKLECTLRFQRTGEVAVDLLVNQDQARRVVDAARDLGQLMGASASLRVGELLRWPGVVTEVEPDLSPVMEAAVTAFADALQALREFRAREGAQLRNLVEQRCQGVVEITAQLRQRLPQLKSAWLERLRRRFAEFKVEADEARLEQEVVVQAQKLDVDEELDRLDAHIAEVRKALGLAKPVGRRLDFLMQELHREANTLGAKAAALETANAAIDLKVLIEQMREQIQNIE